MILTSTATTFSDEDTILFCHIWLPGRLRLTTPFDWHMASFSLFFVLFFYLHPPQDAAFIHQDFLSDKGMPALTSPGVLITQVLLDRQQGTYVPSLFMATNKAYF